MRSAGLVAATFLTACSALPERDLLVEYFDTVREMRLTPVYPPREDLQVGDVIFFTYDPNAENDLDSTTRRWLGSLTSVMEVSNDYLASRINYESSVIDSSGTPDASIAIRAGQTDLGSGTVSLNNGERRTLPLVSFPSITGRASSAASLGGYGFLQSFGLALGRNETVTLDFGDTRAFGLPDGGVAIDGEYEHEFRREICPIMMDVAFRRAENGVMTPACPAGLECRVAIVTRTFMTRSISFNYTNARIARLALNRLSGPVSDEPSTLPLPGNLDVNVTLGPDADGTELDQLLSGMNTNLESAQVAGQETSGLNFVGLQGNGLVFQRTFLKPVAVAYDALAGEPQFFANEVCMAMNND